MARIDVAMPSDNSEVKIEPTSGDQVVMHFNTGPNAGPGYISIGTSGGVSFSGQLYADANLTQPIGPRSGVAAGALPARFGIGEPYETFPQVALNADLWYAVDVNAAGITGPLGTSANLHLPQPQRDHPPHRRHDRQR